MSERLGHVMIGLPEAGKTTFLAALWHVLCEEDVDDSLKLSRLSGDHNYLNKIREAWAKLETLGRTNPGDEPFLSFVLKDKESDTEIEIQVPDISGEAFESYWANRTIEEERKVLYSEISGALLFINPANLRKEVLISEIDDVANELDGDEEQSHENDDSFLKWDPNLSPTQIQLVDLLQIVSRLNPNRPFRLAVVISAWDLISGKIKPSNWVKRELPLLWQFLNSNFELFDSCFFGVSCQGGDLEVDRKEIEDIDSPSERIELVGDDSQPSNDITMPLKWLMSADVDR